MAGRRPVDIGTKFETAVCRYLRNALGDERIERRAKHGSRDMGDIFGLVAHGHEGIVECKAHKTHSGADLREWRRQTERERGNADAGFALLVVKRRHCNGEDASAPSFGAHEVHVQIADLLRVAGIAGSVAAFGDALDQWVSLPLSECCALMLGEVPDDGEE